MNRADYEKGHQVLELLKQVGKIISTMDSSISEQNSLLNPISDGVNTVNAWLAKGRHEAENEVFIKPTSLRDIIQWLRACFTKNES